MNNSTSKKTPSDYRLLATKRQFEWIGGYPQHTFLKTSWRCPSGHEWNAPYADIRSGYGCPFCAGNLPKTDDDYHALARIRGLEWIGERPSKVSGKSLWRCPEGHIWNVRYNDIQSGKGCPVCSRCRQSDYKRIPLEKYHELAQKRGLQWVGAYPSNSHANTTWRCACGHEWETGFQDIQTGHGCPMCAWKRNIDKQRLTPDFYHQLATTFDLVWLGAPVSRIGQKTNWRCSKGHEFWASYNNLTYSSDCPSCIDCVNGHKVSNPQRELHSLLGGNLNLRVGIYAIDVALVIDGIQIAIEYDCWYWHKSINHKEPKRDAFLLEHGWRILHIRTDLEFPTSEQLAIGITELLDGASTAEIMLDWGGT